MLTVFHLYVILDVFSRYVVGWTVQHRENAELAKALIAQAVAQQRIEPGQLTMHADRGTAMSSKPVAFLLADLGVTKTHSRPYTSTTTPTRRRTSRPSSTGPGSPPASTRSSTPARSAAILRLVQPRSTATPGSA